MRSARWLTVLCLTGLLVTLAAGWQSIPVHAQADGLGSTISETGPSWTATWTRRPGTTTWDGSYSTGAGHATVMTIVRSGATITATRTSSVDGNLCTYRGALQADGVTVKGHADCTAPDYPGFDFTLTLGDAQVPAAGAQVWTLNAAGTQNPPQYHLGDNIQVCFSQPNFGAVVLNDLTSDGNSSVLYQSGGSPTGTCTAGIVVGPLGQECVRLDYTPIVGGVSGGTSSVQTCWVDVP
jgi:hypothetical protein